MHRQPWLCTKLLVAYLALGLSSAFEFPYCPKEYFYNAVLDTKDEFVCKDPRLNWIVGPEESLNLFLDGAALYTRHHQDGLVMDLAYHKMDNKAFDFSVIGKSTGQVTRLKAEKDQLMVYRGTLDKATDIAEKAEFSIEDDMRILVQHSKISVSSKSGDVYIRDLELFAEPVEELYDIQMSLPYESRRSDINEEQLKTAIAFIPREKPISMFDRLSDFRPIDILDIKKTLERSRIYKIIPPLCRFSGLDPIRLSWGDRWPWCPTPRPIPPICPRVFPWFV